MIGLGPARTRQIAGGKARATHWLIGKVALEMALAFYEEVASDNMFRRCHPDQKAFARAYRHNFIHPARRALAMQLRDPAIPIEQKEIIREALILDRGIPGGVRGGPPTGGVRQALIQGRLING